MSQNRGLVGVRGNDGGGDGEEGRQNGVLWLNWGVIPGGVGHLSGGSQGLGGALARGERFRVAALYGPAEPGSGGESGSHPGEIPAPAGGASQAAASLGFLERRSRAGFHSS